MTAVKSRPILFNADMVRAILEGRKTQTRRVVNPQPEDVGEDSIGIVGFRNHKMTIEEMAAFCPYGAPSDLLYVQESWAVTPDLNSVATSGLSPRRTSLRGVQHATLPCVKRLFPTYNPWPNTMWREASEMPRWASRITLRVTDVRVERLQEISYGDAIAEGIEQNILGWIDYSASDRLMQSCGEGARSSFATLWDSINAKRGFGWDVNPWIWVVSFEVVTP